MNKSDLVMQLIEKSKKTDIVSVAAAERLVDNIFDIIKTAVEEGNNVTISNFGTFRVVSRAKRICFNLHDKTMMNVDAKKLPKFIPSKKFKDDVNKKM